MSQIQLQISAKQLKSNVHYINPIKSYIVDTSGTLPSVEKMNFLALNLPKEVKSKKEGKKFVKVALKTIMVSVSLLTLVDPTFTLAATTQPATTTEMITSEDIIKLCKYLVGICMAIGFGIAMVLSVVASSWGMFRKKDSAFTWVMEIIKSVALMMLAPTIIITIAIVAYMLFGSSEWFQNPL